MKLVTFMSLMFFSFIVANQSSAASSGDYDNTTTPSEKVEGNVRVTGSGAKVLYEMIPLVPSCERGLLKIAISDALRIADLSENFAVTPIEKLKDAKIG